MANPSRGGKSARDTEPKTSQEASTAPRDVDAEGRELDGYGLPISGPARAKALAGRLDPALDGFDGQRPGDVRIATDAEAEAVTSSDTAAIDADTVAQEQ